jgi:hypothetical protein
MFDPCPGDCTEPDDDACVDADDQEWPEHDWPDEGYECRRCGAELSDEPDGIYDGEIR